MDLDSEIIRVVPTHGRDYKNTKDALSDWKENKDFAEQEMRRPEFASYIPTLGWRRRSACVRTRSVPFNTTPKYSHLPDTEMVMVFNMEHRCDMLIPMTLLLSIREREWEESARGRQNVAPNLSSIWNPRWGPGIRAPTRNSWTLGRPFTPGRPSMGWHIGSRQRRGALPVQRL